MFFDCLYKFLWEYPPAWRRAALRPRRAPVLGCGESASKKTASRFFCKTVGWPQRRVLDGRSSTELRVPVSGLLRDCSIAGYRTRHSKQNSKMIKAQAWCYHIAYIFIFENIHLWVRIGKIFDFFAIFPIISTKNDVFLWAGIVSQNDFLFQINWWSKNRVSKLYK